jgi:tripartite-type tricarboxylate transporter receptor subunit TctC
MEPAKIYRLDREHSATTPAFLYSLNFLYSAIAAMKGGRVRALAITSPQRSKQLPDIPTLAESGVPGYSTVAWIVFLAPSKTPSDLIARINGDVARSFTSPELVARTEALGFEVLASSPETALQELRAYSMKWAQLVKERNIKVE